MSKEHPVILYVGKAKQAEALRQVVTPCGWYIYDTNQLMEGLAMYVFYQPDVVVVNATGDGDLAENAHLHLASVQAEPILMLTNVHSIETDPHTLYLPQNTTAAELMDLIEQMLGKPAKARW